MTKAQALAAATDAVTVMAQTVYDYGQDSPEFAGAKEAATDAFRLAAAHGATDDELRATQARH